MFPFDEPVKNKFTENQGRYHFEPLPSIDKSRHGFDGQKCPHTASSPLRIRQYSLRVFPCLGTFLLRQNCRAPASHGFSSDFWLLRRRRAGARQGEKGKKRRKDTLAGVSALVNRWYYYLIRVCAPLALTVTNNLPCAFSEEPFSGYPFSHAQKEQPPQE